MANNIFRSGAKHSVATNEITKHAINPRHEFSLDKRLIVDEGMSSIEKKHLKDDVYFESNLNPLKNQQLLKDDAESLKGAGPSELREIEKRVTFYEKKARSGYVDRGAPAVEKLAPEESASSQVALEGELPKGELPKGEKKSSRPSGRFNDRLRELKERLQNASDLLARVKSDLD